MADSTINLKLSGLKEIKKELRELQYDLSQATDPKQMAELAEKAGELQDNLNRANEQARVFAAGSPFEKSSNALGLMGSQLMSLDFEGAAESSKLFASSLKSITPEQISTQLKGLVSMVGTLSKAFIQFGISLLMNPIFLIAAAIAALVAIILVIMNKLGILKPILKAIGDVFKYIMKIVDGLVAAFEMLTDWLGLTANAAEDSAERQNAALEKTSELRKRYSEEAINGMNHQIALMKVEGKDVAIAEAQKLKYIYGVAKAEQADLKRRIDNHTFLGDLSDEELNKLKESLSEQTKAMRTASQDLEVLRAENKKKVEENAKKVKEGQAKAYETSKAEAKQRAKDELDATRLLRDLEIELMTENIDKELAVNNEKYKRLIEDTNKNEKLNAETKAKVISDYEMLAADGRAKINQKRIDDEKAVQDKLNEFQKNANLQNEADEEAFTDAYNAKLLTKSQAEIQAVTDKYYNLIEQAKIYGKDVVELERQQQAELDAIKENSRKEEKRKEQELRAAKVDLISQGLTATANLVSAFAGKSEAAQKKAFEIQKKISIAQAIVDTYKGANAAFNSMASIPVVGPALGGIAAGFAIASGIANVKKISSTKFGSTSVSGGGGASGGSAPSVSGGTPQTNLFGQANQGNNVSSPKDVESGQQQMVVKAVVVESDITSSQNHINKIQNNAFL